MKIKQYPIRVLGAKVNFGELDKGIISELSIIV